MKLVCLETAAGLLHFGKYRGVICRVGYDGHAFKIFRGRAQHRRAAYIDIFYGVLEGAAGFFDIVCLKGRD